MAFKKEEFINTLDDMFGFNLSNRNDGVEYDFGQYKLNRIYKPLIKYFIKQFSNSLEISNFDDKEKQRILDIFVDFFSLYYKNGDFGYFKSKFNNYQYRVQYSGKDTEFFWATKDCYYVKTSDVVNEMDLNIGGLLGEGESLKIKFFKKTKLEITEGGKEKYTFSIDIEEIKDEEGEEVIGKSFIIYNFEEDKTSRATKIKNIKDFMKENGVDVDNSSELKNTLEDFLKKWGRDYFIHKRLGEFLREELEWFFFQVLKNDLQGQIDILNIKKQIEEIKEKYEGDEDVIQFKIGKLIEENKQDVNKSIYEFVYAWIYNFINILANLEEFKKSLWLKKRKITKKEFCITLGKFMEIIDLIPLRGEILEEILNNEKQIKEWEELLEKGFKHLKDIDINIVKEELKSGNLDKSINFVVDTINFEKDSKVYKKLEELGEKELYENESLDGILIKSENFQGINFLLENYKNKIQCIYIDPPYNAKSSEIIYKNEYKHSCWASFMENRIKLAKELLTDDGVLIIAIDENEMKTLDNILTEIYEENKYEKNCITVVHNPKGIQGGYLSINNEYAYVISNKGHISNDKILDKNSWISENFRNWGGESERNTAKNCFYPILVKDGKIYGFGDVCADNFHPEQNIKRDDGIIEIYPIDNNGIERKWTFARQSVEKILDRLEVFKNGNKNYDIKKIRKTERFKSVWNDSKYIAGDYGSKIINNIIGEKKFDFPKSLHLVLDSLYMSSNKNSLILDFFSGSGTTQQAVIELNKLDGGTRKYIGIEIGNHFDTVIVPRLKKISFTNNWKNGIPQDLEGNNNYFSYNYSNQYQNWFDENGYMSKIENEVKKVESMDIDNKENKIEDIVFNLKNIKDKIYNLDENIN